jgi:hypothetical protein
MNINILGLLGLAFGLVIGAAPAHAQQQGWSPRGFSGQPANTPPRQDAVRSPAPVSAAPAGTAIAAAPPTMLPYESAAHREAAGTRRIQEPQAHAAEAPVQHRNLATAPQPGVLVNVYDRLVPPRREADPRR